METNNTILVFQVSHVKMPDKKVKCKTAETPAAAARRRIVLGARRYFFAEGFRRVTMGELAAELGMSKRTLYQHFTSKQELLKEVLVGKLDEVDAGMAKISDEGFTDFSRALEEMLAFVQSQIEEIQPHFIHDIRREAPELFQVVEHRRRGIIQRHFGRLFAEGRKAGVFRKDVPSHLMVEILLGAVQAIVNPGKLAELNLTLKTGYSTIIKVLLDGIVVRKETS
jgi:AcrR family transcriptional regulator